jgi:hypothetical protein
MITSKINPEIKELWCTALESEEYPQATNRLRTETGFCCLGVLSDLAVKAGVQKWIHNADDDDCEGYGIPNEDGSFTRGLLHRDIQKWAGLTGPSADDPVVRIANETHRLSGLNDSGYDFKSIARLIREQL